MVVHEGDDEQGNREVCDNFQGCESHSCNRCSEDEDGRRKYEKSHEPSWLQVGLQNEGNPMSVVFQPEKPRSQLGKQWVEGSSKESGHEQWRKTQ